MQSTPAAAMDSPVLLSRHATWSPTNELENDTVLNVFPARSPSSATATADDDVLRRPRRRTDDADDDGADYFSDDGDDCTFYRDRPTQLSVNVAHSLSPSNSPLSTAIDPPRVPAFPFLLERQQQLGGWLSWLADVQIERHGKRRLLVSIIFWLLCGYVNIIFCNLADFRRQELPARGVPLNAKLPDLGHDIIPESNIPFLPDYFISTLTISTLAMLLMHKHRLGIFRRYFYIHGILLLFRSTTIIVTSLPDPQPRCGSGHTWKGLFASVNPFFSDTCGDLIFSGHTVVLTLQGMIWTDYGPKSKIVQRLVWLVAYGGMISLLSVRYHYTIDILIAYFLAKRGWKWYGHLTRDRRLRNQDPIVSYLERRSSDADLQDAIHLLRQKREKVGETVHTVKQTIFNRRGGPFAILKSSDSTNELSDLRQ